MRGKLIVLFASAMLGLSACGGSGGDGDQGDPGTGGNVSEVEPNNTPSTAQAITPPVTITGSVNMDTDETDGFKFTPSASGTYTITLNGFAAPHDLDLTVQSSSALIAQSDNVDQTPEILTVSLTGGTTYYVVVWAFDTSGNAAYTLNVNPAAAPKQKPVITGEGWIR